MRHVLVTHKIDGRTVTEDLHTSGHATADDIGRMIRTVKSQKYIVPIHTRKPEMFEKLGIGEYSEKIELIDDSGIVEV